MNRTIPRFMRAAVLVFLTLGASQAQNQQPASFVRDYCIKVANGKTADYAAYTHDVTAKLIQGRVDSGEAWPRRFCSVRSRIPPSNMRVACVCLRA